MVRLVVVAVIHASSPDIVRVRNLGQDLLLVTGILQVEHSEMLLPPDIYVNGGIWAGRLVRTAVSAAQRCSLRRILRLEPGQGAVRHNAPARLAHEPAENVQVVAALGKDDRGGLLGVTPVAPHV